MSKKMTALIIMDGFGINPRHDGNAIYQEGTPNIDALEAEYPYTQLGASGMDVGLPDGQMGNSEVGHTNMGAGRIVYQELTRITKDIRDGEFFKNEALVWAMDEAKKNDKALHLMGLVSDGGVHSHNTHLYGLLEMAKKRGLKKVFVHAFLDGRDVPPSSGADFVAELQKKCEEIGVGEIATVMGRYWAMDRDNIWERVEKAYDAIVLGKGEDEASDAVSAVKASYDKGVTDEFVHPTVITKGGKPVGMVEENDSVIFFNFRPDRARQLTRTFIMPDFNGFERKKGFFHVNFVSMTQYDETFTGLKVANPPEALINTFGKYISELGLTQLRIAETQKYAHVTFFFNGGVEEPNKGEDRELIPSSKVATFDMKPEMSAYEVTEKAVELINSGKYDVMILNFANCDMVGHTGIMEAAEKAVKTVDECVKTVVDAILKNGGRAFVTADHGNADQMVDYETGEPFTAHTTNPVPFIMVDPAAKDKKLRAGGRLADIAPTMLDSMGIPVPKEMTGKTLIEK
ncbi:MAG: 2,3-bisphosphoglycerate-independent phosphoglycerate mutase [Eubacteriales bacterium]|nr:2,3-bisphosphoglycerate-independent phosphoglycerate mutase [Eubacteriales bacterium]MDD3882447.1 2,3-bisphosphoglycerate-independent phosphoglycerate mutase [Eubacteriales bacterium]MDD4513169.1 2,3-bisphosphoglycerate-independent phosphoglycerate mutase [Eubacteriales bacterium]